MATPPQLVSKHALTRNASDVEINGTSEFKLVSPSSRSAKSPSIPNSELRNLHLTTPISSNARANDIANMGSIQHNNINSNNKENSHSQRQSGQQKSPLSS